MTTSANDDRDEDAGGGDEGRANGEAEAPTEDGGERTASGTEDGDVPEAGPTDDGDSTDANTGVSTAVSESSPPEQDADAAEDGAPAAGTDGDATDGETAADGPTEDYHRLTENPYAQPVPEAFVWPDEVPDWSDEPYLEAAALRLLHHYDLERDYRMAGRTYQLYGYLEISNERHAMHPALTFAEHYTREHLFVTEEPHPRMALFERTESLADELADRWIEADESHHSTDFTFVVVAESIPEDVRAFVDGYRNRTMFKFGYHGHWELNFVVVAPDEADLVQSENTDVGTAFQSWEPIEQDEPGRISRFLDWVTR